MLARELIAQKLAAAIGTVSRGCALRLVGSFKRPWHSATFSGVRHRLTFEAAVADEAELTSAVQAIPEFQFDLPGTIVADAHASVRRDDGDILLDVELLTVVTC